MNEQTNDSVNLNIFQNKKERCVKQATQANQDTLYGLSIDSYCYAYQERYIFMIN